VVVILVLVGLAVVGNVFRDVDVPSSGGSGNGAGTGATARSTERVTGSGIEKSDRFNLEGDYAVSWTATPDSDVGCYHGAFLRDQGDDIEEFLVNETLDGTASASGTTNVYSLDAGSYYIDANSGCDWTFTFAPS
jgi:hypothetical protein